MVRLSQEGDEGIFMRKIMVSNMWIDMDKRSKKLGVSISFCCVLLYLQYDVHLQLHCMGPTPMSLQLVKVS